MVSGKGSRDGRWQKRKTHGDPEVLLGDPEGELGVALGVGLRRRNRQRQEANSEMVRTISAPCRACGS